MPEQVPAFQIALSEVGILGKTVWVALPEGRLPFEAEVYVDLPGHVRGIHMSRIEEAVTDLFTRGFADLRQYAAELAARVLSRQKGETARVSLKGKVPVLRPGQVTAFRSADGIEISAEARARRSAGHAPEVALSIGVRLAHITACPCTQGYYRVLASPAERGFPLPTHSQRAVTALVVDDTRGAPAYVELLHCLERALHVSRDLLKRPDEAEMVLRAHRIPQFAEDAARETARAVGELLGNRLPESTSVSIQSLSYESIHTRDVGCVMRTTIGEILRRLGRGSGRKGDRRGGGRGLSSAVS